MGTQEQFSQVIPYLRGELEPLDEVAFEDALRRLPELRREVEEVRNTLATLTRSLPDVEPAENLRMAFRSRLAAEPQESIPRPSIPDLVHELGPRARRRRVGWTVAAAASIALALTFLLRQQTTPPAPDPPTRAAVESFRGDVMVSEPLNPAMPAWPVAQSGSNVNGLAVLRLDQRLTTGPNSSAALRLEDDSRIWLDENSSVAMIRPSAYIQQGEAVRVDAGRVTFDVTTREHKATADDKNTIPRVLPFVVHTPHGEIRVRGTRFYVDVRDATTLVLVYEGRVDVLSGAGATANPDIRRIEPGWFAALGTPAALEALLPTDPAGADAPKDSRDASATDPLNLLGNSPDSRRNASGTPDIDGVGHEPGLGVGGPVVPPIADGQGVVVIARPLIRVTLELSHREVLDTDMGEAAGRVTVANCSPFLMRLDHDANHDNVKLKHLAPEATSAGWVPVTSARPELQRGESKCYEIPLQRALYRERYGAWYLGAVYDGPIDLLGLAHPDLRDRAEWNRVASCTSVSRQQSVLYSAGD